MQKVSQREIEYSAAGTRTRVSWVRAKYPNQLDYSGSRKLCVESEVERFL